MPSRRSNSESFKKHDRGWGRRRISTTQIQFFETTDLSALNGAQIAAFTSIQLGTMTSTQLSAIGM